MPVVANVNYKNSFLKLLITSHLSCHMHISPPAWWAMSRWLFNCATPCGCRFTLIAETHCMNTCTLHGIVVEAVVLIVIVLDVLQCPIFNFFNKTDYHRRSGPRFLFLYSEECIKMRCKTKTLIGWRNIWNMRWRAPDQEVDQRGYGERLCKKTAKHVIWTGKMLWIMVDGRS